MTEEQLKSVGFHFVSSLSIESEHCVTYEDSTGELGYCDHQHYKDGVPHGRGYRHYRIGTKVYKARKKFLDTLKDYEYKNQD